MKNFAVGLIAMGGLVVAGLAFAAEAPMKLTTGDGRVVILYSDKTWEFERPAPVKMNDTVSANDLVERPDKLRGKELVVTGKVVTLFGAYHLQSTKPQNSIILDVTGVRRAEQIALEKRMKEVGLTGSVQVQIQGTVEKGTIADHVKATNLFFVK